METTTQSDIYFWELFKHLRRLYLGNNITDLSNEYSERFVGLFSNYFQKKLE